MVTFQSDGDLTLHLVRIGNHTYTVAKDLSWRGNTLVCWYLNWTLDSFDDPLHPSRASVILIPCFIAAQVK